MKRDEVPQDQSKTYGGHQKILYAVDQDGSYTSVHSNGWEVEEQATHCAIAEMTRLASETWGQVNAGIASPLAYHMYSQRMDIELLAQSTGLFKWRVKRHLKPKIFTRLDDKLLERYAQALGLSIETLKTLPPSAE